MDVKTKVTFRLTEPYSKKLDALVELGHGKSRNFLARQLVMIALDAPERDVLMASLTTLSQQMKMLMHRCDDVEANQLQFSAAFAAAFELLFLAMTQQETACTIDANRLHEMMTTLFFDP